MADKRKVKTDVDDVLTALQNDLNKHLGKDSVVRLNAQQSLCKVNVWMSSRSIVVDSVLRGGRPVGSSLVPFGRQIEISGTENAGKTTLCAHIAAETQDKDGIVIITDAEERIDVPYWEKLGVDTSRILHLTARSIEEVFDKQYEALTRARNHTSDRPILMIWDSLGGTSTANLIDPASKDTPMEQAKSVYGRQAAEISAGMRLINEVIAETNACYLYTNHVYSKMGVTYGDALETYGGQKPKYFATVRLRLEPTKAIYEADGFSKDSSKNKKTIGMHVRVKALKNQMSGVLLQREAHVLAGRGFSNEMTVYESAKRAKLIQGKGWYEWTTPSGKVVGKFQGFKGFLEKVVPHGEYPDLLDQVIQTL